MEKPYRITYSITASGSHEETWLEAGRSAGEALANAYYALRKYMRSVYLIKVELVA